MAPCTAAPPPESQVPPVVLDGPVVAMIQRFPCLLRGPYGDKVEGGRLKGQAWSALRMLRRIGLESDDDQEICAAAEEAERVATVISDALETVNSSPRAATQVDDHHRLCPCRIHVELSRVALMLGKKFWVPIVSGQYSGTGPSERTLLRTFFLSPERPHVVYLDFQVLAERIDKDVRSRQVPKVIVELQNEHLTLEQDIEGKGIAHDESDE